MIKWPLLLSSFLLFVEPSLQSDDPTIESLVLNRNYPLETHEIITQDGYILTVHRIPHGRNNNTVGKPVILQHGVLCSSAVWVIPEPKASLAFVLADNGYDVWMTNSRGNTYSRKHVTLDPNKDKEKFWDFSFHEMGYYDTPAEIDYILNKTGEKQLYYVGHSQGTTQFFAMGATRPQYNSKVKHMSALAPVSFLTHSRGGVLLLGKFGGIISKVTKLFGLYSVLNNGFWMNLFEASACRAAGFEAPLCADTLFLLSGYDSVELDLSLIPNITEFLPAGSSSKQLVHYSQLVRNGGKFTQFDYGWWDNLEHYNQRSPPEYDLSKVSTPIMLHYASNDWVSGILDVQKLARLLPNALKKLVPFKKFNHIDYMWATHAYEFVYKDVLEHMGRY